jgi:hypothetical protein
MPPEASAKRKAAISRPRKEHIGKVYYAKHNPVFDKFRKWLPECHFYDASHLRSKDEFDNLVMNITAIGGVPYDPPVLVAVIYNKNNHEWISNLVGASDINSSQHISILRLNGWVLTTDSPNSRFYGIDRRITKHQFRRTMLKEPEECDCCDICIKQLSMEDMKFDLHCPACGYLMCRACVDGLEASKNIQDGVIDCPACRKVLRTDPSLNSWDQ